jgi:uncharacterized caspase-like protein
VSKRLALVIGNAHFPKADTLDDLKTPLDDARSLATTLQDLGDFEISHLLLDENATVAKARIEEFLQQAGRGDLALLYYSGHGFKDRTGALYLATQDTETHHPLTTAVAASFIKDAIQLSDCKHVVVILDSCYAGTFQLGGKGKDEGLPFADTLKGETVAVLASSRGSQVSFEGEGTYSKFTEVLLEGIRTSRADKNLDGKITLQELFDYVRDNLSGQLPTLQLGKSGDDIYIARGLEQDLRAVYITSVEADNYLHAWLNAKLQQVGYHVATLAELDEDNETAQLEQLSRMSAAFVPLMSGSAVQDVAFMKQIALAMQVQAHRPLFVPADVGGWYNETFKFSPLISCDFTGSWAEGYRQVVAHLEKLNVPKTLILESQDLLTQWKKSLGVRESFQAEKTETYRSNWYAIDLPKYIYVLALNPKQELNPGGLDYPVVHHPPHLISFARKDKFDEHLEIWEEYEVDIDDFLREEHFVVEDGTVISSPNHKLIELLGRTLERQFEKKGLSRYEQFANSVFYFAPQAGEEESHKRVSLKSLGHTSMQLTGKMETLTWHYGLSAQVFLYPYPAYFLTAHVIFTEQGRPIDPKRQHNRRRKKGKDLYNKQWRNLMLAALLELSDDPDALVIDTGGETPIRIKNQPIAFTSPVGYQEPSKVLDAEDIDDAEDEEDVEDEVGLDEDDGG